MLLKLITVSLALIAIVYILGLKGLLLLLLLTAKIDLMITVGRLQSQLCSLDSQV
jgi:hypothetical protein